MNGAARRVAILVLPSFSNMTLSAVMEPLRIANRMAGRQLFGWSVLSEAGTPITSSSGLRVMPDASLAGARGFDALFVVASYEAERNTTEAVRRFIRTAARSGCLIGGMETGAYALAAAGVLDGYRATTHWEDLGDLGERYPTIKTVPDRFVIDRRRVTSGGALPTLDLMLDLIRREHGVALALSVSSSFIYDGDRTGREPQHMVSAGRLAWQDPVLIGTIRLMEANIETPISIEAIAADARISPRELLRRFSSKLGTSPKAFYIDLRLTLARRLLENTDQSVSAIAAACGFISGSDFARAFKLRFGMTPSELRRL
jgi:AraC family transcriptional regulator, glycine betaine-responsive activator